MSETVPAGDPRSVESPAPESPEAVSDPELIAATREGDTTAYAVLYERHVHAARRLARVLSHDAAAADDLVSETFAKLLHTFREGNGPDLAFRPYMLRTLRNTFYDRVRRDKRVEFTDDITKHDPGELFVDPAVEGQERRYAVLAFGKLPERWQMVLWHTEVEDETPAKVATMLGMTANGVSALAYRAREKLRQNYLTEHAADSPPEECRWTVDRLGARVRERLGVRDAQKVDGHLEDCVSCNLLFAELTELNSGLRGTIAGVFLGTAAVPYLAAGTATAAGAAVGGFFGVLLTPFTAVANWIRRVFQQLGTKGGIATGTAVAVVAAAAVFALTSGDPEDPEAAADPPAASEPEDESDPPDLEQDDPDAPDPDDPDQPAEDEPGEEPDDPDQPAPPADEDEPADEPADQTEPPTAYGIEHGLGTTGLAAGDEGVLPIVLEEQRSGGGYVPAADRSAESGRPGESSPVGRGQAPSSTVSLEIALPEGITLASEDADPGWSCESDDDLIRCRIREMPDPAVAEVRVAIADHVSGFQTFTVTVSGPGVGGTSELRVPVAPPNSEVGFASLDATGVTAVGNTWLVCAIPGCRETTGLGAGDRYPMKPYKAPWRDPQPPAGRDGEALSGAALDVPSGATVVWAGLYWAGAEDDLPSEVSMAGPNGSWTDLSAAEVTGTDPGEQAFVEVTDLVDGGGEYWVSVDNHALPVSKCAHWPPRGKPDCMDPHWAGWSLSVVFAEPGAEKREVAVYDGAPAADTEIEVRGGGEVTVASTLWGGSGYETGDAYSIGGHGLGQPGRCRANGAVNNPHWYTFGVDVLVDTVAVGEDGVIRYNRGGDDFIVGVVAVAAPR